MSTDRPVAPFRWSIAKREQLGRLLDGPETPTYRGFYSDLRTVAAKLVARSGGNRLVFIGRSGENIFDYLSGVFDGVNAPGTLALLQFSSPPESVPDLARRHARALSALHAYFAAEQLDPASLASHKGQVRFADTVNTGYTFDALFALLKHWSASQRVDWRAVADRIGFIGITAQEKNSPKTWRWHQHRPWTAELKKSSIKNISVPNRFWTCIANHDAKTTPSFTLERWTAPDANRPPRDERHLQGLRMAVQLFERGRGKSERAKFAKELGALPEVSDPMVRAQLTRLRSR